MKAYTISVLNILKSAEILEQMDGQRLSGKDFFSKVVQSDYQKGKRNQKPKVLTGSIDSDNERDIRAEST